MLFAWRRSHPDLPTGARLLAVLPFENVGDSTEEYFADGITDAVRGKLTGLPGLEVIAGRSSSLYKHTDKDLTQIARELGVTHLVTAKVRWAKTADGGRRVQVVPELVQVTPGGSPTTRWQQSFDAAMTDVFKVQAEVAEQVAEQLGVALADSTRRELAARPTQNLAAYDLYLRAEAAALGPGFTDPAALRAAIPLYERAVALDSSFALAWAQLAIARSYLYLNGGPTPELKLQARAAADRAVALAPGTTPSVMAMVNYHRLVEQKLEPALREVARGVRPESQGPETPDRPGQHRGVPRPNRGRPRPSPRGPAARSALREHRDGHRPQSAGAPPVRVGGLDPRTGPRARAGQFQPHPVPSPGAARAWVTCRARARSCMPAPPRMDTRSIAVYMATYLELWWVLDSAEQALVIGSRVEDFEGDAGSWGLAHANILAAWGDRTRSRAYADSGRAAFARDLKATPDDAQLHSLLGLTLALMGRTDEALEHAKRGTALQPAEQNPDIGVYLEEILARIYVMAGQPEKAVERLEVVLALPVGGLAGRGSRSIPTSRRSGTIRPSCGW